jgi:hypothetical protein
MTGMSFPSISWPRQIFIVTAMMMSEVSHCIVVSPSDARSFLSS